MAGPPTSIDPPDARTPFAVVYSFAVSKSHNTRPSVVEYARKCPSSDPENTAPGIAALGAESAGLQDGLSPHALGRATQACDPFVSRIANSPPPTSGFRPPRPRAIGSLKVMSETGTYMFVPSLDDPHSMPPSIPPFPISVVHSLAPLSSGSNACTIPDFCPATRIRLPVASGSRMADCPKSWSGPAFCGQFVVSALVHAI